MRTWGVATFLVSTLWLSGCRDRHQFQEQYDPLELGISSDMYRVFTVAPIVVVGTVTRTRQVGGPHPARRRRELLVQLMDVEIHVEDVLRGKLTLADNHFYFFGVSDENAGYSGPPRYRVTPGERRIFFLTQEDGQLRSAGDILDYTLLVTTGRHPRQKPDEPLGDRIAEILLSPNPGYDSNALKHVLREYCPISDHLSSRENTVFLLKKLVSSGDQELHVAGCLYLAENYSGQYGCLVELLSLPGLSAEARARIDKDWNAALQSDAALKDVLRHYPLQAFSSIPFPDSLYAVRGELRLLLDDPDREIQALSCRALHQFYSEQEPRCLTTNISNHKSRER
jgi:hypothetical protein